jgi:hypothetical protein
MIQSVISAVRLDIKLASASASLPFPLSRLDCGPLCVQLTSRGNGWEKRGNEKAAFSSQHELRVLHLHDRKSVPSYLASVWSPACQMKAEVALPQLRTLHLLFASSPLGNSLWLQVRCMVGVRDWAQHNVVVDRGFIHSLCFACT